MIVARLRLAPMWGTAGSPHEPPSLSTLLSAMRLVAAPAMSVAAAETCCPTGQGVS